MNEDQVRAESFQDGAVNAIQALDSEWFRSEVEDRLVLSNEEQVEAFIKVFKELLPGKVWRSLRGERY